MMDDPNQGTYTFTGAQLKEQRRQWMDEGRRSALAEQALIEVLPPRPPFSPGDRTQWKRLGMYGSRHVRTVQSCIQADRHWKVFYTDGGWDYASSLELATLREGIDFYV